MTVPTEIYGNFDLIRRVTVRGARGAVISKWVSRVTGLSIVHIYYEAPIVRGFFVVATEAFDDSGWPCTLERLIFMGSEMYPYSSVLDQLSNRALSKNGKTGWTDTDHTAYTISTAGQQGFLQMLPKYVDHILYPTITETGFLTEVYHVTKDAKESGVVFSEIEGRQNMPGALLNLQSQRLSDRPGSGYRSETGGLMEALRKLTPQEIREQHSKYYVPHNLSIIVTGKIDSNALLKVLQDEVEPSLISHKQDKGPRPFGWKRPFVETTSSLRQPPVNTIRQVVEYPSKDPNFGMIKMTCMGPSPHQFLERKALDLIKAYLRSSKTSPLNKELVEIKNPLSTHINIKEIIRASRVDLCITVHAVPANHLDHLDEIVKATLNRVVQEGIDVERMSKLISRDERRLRSQLESEKDKLFVDSAISDFLYGAEDGSELEAFMDRFMHHGELRGWSSGQWTELLKRYYIDTPCIVIIGKPSIKLSRKLDHEKKAIIFKNKIKFGCDGLERAGKTLEDAHLEHSKPIPAHILASFPVPDVKSIPWIPVQSVQEPGVGRPVPFPPSKSQLKNLIDSDGPPLSFFVQYDHVESDFVSIFAHFSLASLPDQLRPYINIYSHAFFSLPLVRYSGKRLSHEDVIDRLEDETVAYRAGLGSTTSFLDIFSVGIKVETSNYENAITWLRDLIYGAEFEKERLAVTVAKLQQNLPQLRLDREKVLHSVWQGLLYNNKSTALASAIITQSEFIPALAKQLQHRPDKVISVFKEIRKYMTNPSGVRFSVTGNVLGLRSPRSTLGKYFSSKLPESVLHPVPVASNTLNDIGRKVSGQAIIMTIPTVRSSYAAIGTNGLLGFDHPEYPIMRVAIEILNVTDGYLGHCIQGAGLAHAAYLTQDLEAGLLTLNLQRTTKFIIAFREAKKLLVGLVDGSIEFPDKVLDSAKSKIVYTVTKQVSSPVEAAIVSFYNQALRGVPETRHVELLQKFHAVTKQEVIAAWKKRLLPLFDSETSVAVVVTHQAKADKIHGGLSAYGYEVTRQDMAKIPRFKEGDGKKQYCKVMGNEHCPCNNCN